jgi:ParB family chromosome partitioning protein
MEVELIPIEQIVEDPDQPRKGYDEESLQGLADSIRQHGLLNPITVRPLHNVNMFQIITGERRWRASKLAGLKQLPCIIKNVDEQEAAVEQLIENLQREDLAPIDKARGLKLLKSTLNVTNREIAKVLGLSDRTIGTLLSILELPEEIGEQIVVSAGRPPAGAITERHARSLRELNESPEIQSRMADKIRDEELTSNETAALVRTLRDDPDRATELLDRPADETVRKSSVTGPAVHIQHFCRYLDSLDLPALHPGHLRSLENVLEELLEIVAVRLEDVREQLEAGSVKT